MAANKTVSKEQLKAAFDEIDTSKSGKLTTEQFQTFAKKFEQISNKDINDIFKHMDVHKEEKAITFDEFYLWWENKERNFLPVLYLKQSIQKQISKAKQAIQKQKETQNQKQDQNKFEVSITNGSNEGQTLVGFYFSSHKQAKQDSEKYRQAFNLDAKPSLVIKLKTSKNVDEAKAGLEDLVEQIKQFIECILPIEMSEQYMSIVDIKVEKDGDFLLLSFSSGDSLLTSIAAQYQGIINEFQVHDESAVLKVTFTSQLDIGKSGSTKNSVIADVIKGLQINADLSVSSFILDNIRSLFYAKLEKDLKQEDGTYAEYPRRKKREEAAMLVLASLINGISIKLNSQKIEDMLPASITTLTFEQLISEIKTAVSGAEEQLSLPIIQEVLEFFNNYIESDLELIGVFPESFASVHLKTNGASTILNKVFNFQQ